MENNIYYTYTSNYLYSVITDIVDDFERYHEFLLSRFEYFQKLYKELICLKREMKNYNYDIILDIKVYDIIAMWTTCQIDKEETKDDLDWLMTKTCELSKEINLILRSYSKKSVISRLSDFFSNEGNHPLLGINAESRKIQDVKRDLIREQEYQEEIRRKRAEMKTPTITVEKNESDEEYRKEKKAFDIMDTAMRNLTPASNILLRDAKIAYSDRRVFSSVMLFDFMLLLVYSAHAFYTLVLDETQSHKILDFWDVLPWEIPLALLIAIFWVSIFQRNRATRHLVKLDNEIFRINYTIELLKSLYMMTPDKSEDKEEARKKVSVMIERIMDDNLGSTKDDKDEKNIFDEADTPVSSEDVTKIIDSISNLIHKK